jgi:hypothetical protein
MEVYYIEVYTDTGDTVGYLVIAENEDEAVAKIKSTGIGVYETFYEMAIHDLVERHGEDGLLKMSDTIGF